jgi:hypothetical protein
MNTDVYGIFMFVFMIRTRYVFPASFSFVMISSWGGGYAYGSYRG